MNLDEDLVVVYVSQGPLAAEAVKAKLEAEGIQTVLRYSSLGRVMGLTVNGLGRVEVLVAPQDESAARELLIEDQGADEYACGDEPPPED